MPPPIAPTTAPRQIMSFDPKTKLHSVKYRDGDTAELELRHEAVQVRAGLGDQLPPCVLCRLHGEVLSASKLAAHQACPSGALLLPSLLAFGGLCTRGCVVTQIATSALLPCSTLRRRAPLGCGPTSKAGPSGGSWPRSSRVAPRAAAAAHPAAPKRALCPVVLGQPMARAVPSGSGRRAWSLLTPGTAKSRQPGATAPKTPPAMRAERQAVVVAPQQLRQQHPRRPQLAAAGRALHRPRLHPQRMRWRAACTTRCLQPWGTARKGTASAAWAPLTTSCRPPLVGCCALCWCRLVAALLSTSWSCRCTEVICFVFCTWRSSLDMSLRCTTLL